MPTPSPTIRLFVSSTFSDLKAERDALQREVFPQLKQLCLSKGLRFQAIDLRWGISEEAGRDNRTMRICLRELRRCQQDRPKPNFLILLGDRYGWRPLPEIIPASLFEKLEKEIRAKDAKAAKLLTNSYRRDDNAVPPIYELQPRGDNVSWHEQVEKPLLAALEQAAQTLGLDLEKEGVNFGASATEQEIIAGALKVTDAATHVRAFFRTIERLPNPAPEDYLETGEAANRLNKLKDRIGEHIGDGNVCRYRAPWRGDGINADDLKEFCEQAWKQLSGVVELQIAALAKVPPDEQEELAHQDFGKERCRHFVGRSEPLERIANYLRKASGQPLAVIGPSGSGKSAVMAKVVEKVTSCGEKAESICRFIGATPTSSDLIQLLRNLVAEIRRRYQAPATTGPASVEGENGKLNDSEIPFEYNPLVNAFHEALKRPTADRPLFLFLDALDQLTASHNAHSLAWLPGSLNPHVRLIVSAALPSPLEGSANSALGTRHSTLSSDPRATIMAALTSRLDKEHRVTLAPLTIADGEQMLTNWLADAHRTLQPAQRQAVLETFQIEGSPLWLRTAAEEAARLASWQPAPAFAPTTPGLLGQVLDRLSRDEEHGDKLVSRTLSYMACARHGLAEDEILDILSADKEVMADFRRRSPNSPKVDSLPVAVWVRLHGDLAFYLAEHQSQSASLLGFYHRSFLEAVTAHCFASREVRETRHQHMSVYFLDCAKGLDPAKEWETDAVRGFAECVFHLVKAGQHERAAALVSNFPFLLHKLRVGLLQGVFEDYEMLRCEAPAKLVKGLEICTDFFREQAHIFQRGNDEWPTHKILLQLAVEHADDSPLTIGAERWLSEGHCDWLWLRRLKRQPHTQKNPCLSVLEGHTSWVDGALVLADGRILSWSLDHTLRLWEGQSGRPLAVLEGHTGSVGGALALADGRILSWAGNTLRLWEGESGQPLAVLEGHTDTVQGALLLADGQILSWSDDKTLRLWAGQSGRPLAVLEGHTDTVYGALVLADGRILSWSWVPWILGSGEGDHNLRLWEGQSGSPLAVLEGHTDKVNGALVLINGRILSWSDDKTLRLWAGQRGQSMAVLEGHTDKVNGALVLVNGRILSWSDDKTLRFWAGQSGHPLTVLEGHTGSVTGVLALANGRILSWSGDQRSRDDTLRLWDGQSSQPLAVLEGHSCPVEGALALADGRILSWSKFPLWSANLLRLWDGQSGQPLAVLEGHSRIVQGALALANGRILSWSCDNTLRLWDGQSSQPLAILEGHTGSIQGALVIADSRILSWADDKTPRLWDGQSDTPLAVLEGHTGVVNGALVLADGRILSWSEDHTLRLWDGQSGQPLTVLEGHSSIVIGALALTDGRFLSWSSDNTLRFWDGQSGQPLTALEGHTGYVRGALALDDGRILSWSDDHTLRLWDGQNGILQAVLEGHTHWVSGALALANGRILSWSRDNTLRLWEGQSGQPLAVLEGHTDEVTDALVLADSRILSRSLDDTLRLWDEQNGKCLEMVSENQARQTHPKWLPPIAELLPPEMVYGNYFADSSRRSAFLGHKSIPHILAAWNADSDASSRVLLSDGTVVVTQDNGQVCFLRLHHGNRRLSLAEAEAILAPQMK